MYKNGKSTVLFLEAQLQQTALYLVFFLLFISTLGIVSQLGIYPVSRETSQTHMKRLQKTLRVRPQKKASNVAGQS